MHLFLLFKIAYSHNNLFVFLVSLKLFMQIHIAVQENKRNLMKRTSFYSFTCSSPFKKQLPFLSRIALIVLVVFCFVNIVIADDTPALQNTLQSLCSLNKLGSFSKCCSNNPISSVVLSDKNTWSCYLNQLGSSGDSITNLFVSLIIQFTHLCVFRDFQSRGLTLLESGVFSGLSNLLSFFFHFPSF